MYARLTTFSENDDAMMLIDVNVQEKKEQSGKEKLQGEAERTSTR